MSRQLDEETGRFVDVTVSNIHLSGLTFTRGGRVYDVGSETSQRADRITRQLGLDTCDVAAVLVEALLIEDGEGAS